MLIKRENPICSPKITIDKEGTKFVFSKQCSRRSRFWDALDSAQISGHTWIKKCPSSKKISKFGKIFHFGQFSIFLDKSLQEHYLLNCYSYYICTIDLGSNTRSPEVIDLFSTVLLQLDNHLNVKSFYCKYIIYKLIEFTYIHHDWPQVRN